MTGVQTCALPISQEKERQSQYVPHMARAAAAVGIDALFLEVHDNPEEALSDGPNMVRLDKLEKLLTDVLAIDKIVRG